MRDFSSNAEEIKFFIKRLLDEGEEQTTQDIIQYVKAASGKAFTGGMLSGAINDFIHKEKQHYGRIRRGVYSKRTSVNQGTSQDAFDSIIKNAISEVESAQTISINNLTAAKLLKMQTKSNKILAELQKLLEL